MEQKQLTDEERQEVFDTMLKKIAEDHPTWRPKHKQRFANFLTDRFAEDFAAGHIVNIEDEPDAPQS